MLTLKDYFMGRDVKFKDQLTEEFQENASKLLEKVNALLAVMEGKGVVLADQVKVSSGWRPPAVNARVGGAKLSNHMICRAVDLVDIGQVMGKWCMDNQMELKKLGLHMEHISATPTWLHLQDRPPRSGRTVFYP